MAYSDPQGTHNPSTGTSPPAAWGDLVRDDIVWLAGDSASGNGKPMCRVYNSASLSVATATFTALTFNSERYDVGGCHSTATNTGRLTAPTGGAGVYHITAHATFASNATGIRECRIRLNGATYIAAMSATSVSASGDHSMSVSCDYKLAAADYVELVAYQSSGGLLDVTFSANITPEFSWHWVGVG